MKRVLPSALFQIRLCLALSIVLLIVAPINTIAHRSGCHRWHSCPSDSGSYVCGDTGHCSQCPDNQYCQGGSPRVSQSKVPIEPAPVVKAQTTVQTADVMRLDYEGFTVWLDCTRRGSVKFRYNAQRDQGNFKRHGRFYFDPNVPRRCQQTSTRPYKHPGQRYDRGHLVPANHLDYSENAIKQSNYMTNILPQASNMNRGAWLLTKEIVECYRDIDELLVIGGVIWGNNPADDYFVESHGVKTPDAFWKLIIRGKDRVIAWIVPNTQDATKKRLESISCRSRNWNSGRARHFQRCRSLEDRRSLMCRGSYQLGVIRVEMSRPHLDETVYVVRWYQSYSERGLL